MPFKNYSLTKGGQLTIGQIFSPDYIAGTSGWEIRKDGSAEFNNLTIRGTFNGTDFVINSSGAFFYSPSEGAGNLIASIAPAGGTDPYGNSYVSGITSYNGGITVQLTNGTLSLTPFTVGHSPALVTSFTGELILTAPRETNTDIAGQALLYSEAGLPSSPSTNTLQVSDALDANTYGTQRLTVRAASGQGISTVTPSTTTTALTAACGARTYRVSGTLFLTCNTSGINPLIEMAAPGGSGGQIAYTCSRAGTLIATTESAPNFLLGIGAGSSYTSGDVYVCYVNGVIVCGGSGSITMEMAVSATGSFTLDSNSYLDFMPV